jgi:hypothetical protein
MNQREKTILIATIVVMVGSLAFTFLPSGSNETDTPTVTQSAGDVAAARRTFMKNIATLQDGAKINDKYKSIDAAVAEQVKFGRPEQVLANNLYDLLTQRLQVPNPRIGTGQLVEIPSVNDYCFIDISVDISGNYRDIINLLSEMDRIGLLIKTFKIVQRNRNQADTVDLNLTVSRLVKVDEKIRKRLEAANRRS